MLLIENNRLNMMTIIVLSRPCTYLLTLLISEILILKIHTS